VAAALKCMERYGNACTFTDSVKRISDKTHSMQLFHFVRVSTKHSGNLRGDKAIVVDSEVWSFSIIFAYLLSD
jgi:hypothetical protein